MFTPKKTIMQINNYKHKVITNENKFSVYYPHFAYKLYITGQISSKYRIFCVDNHKKFEVASNTDIH